MINFADMNNNQYTEHPEDQFLFDLIGKMPVEKAPEGFTAGIMQQVYSGYEPIAETPEYRKQMLWAYLAIGVALVIFLIMLFAQWPFLKITIPTDQGILRNLLHAGLGFFDGFSKVLFYIKDSSGIIIIFLALTLLLIFERLFRKGFSQDRSFLL